MSLRLGFCEEEITPERPVPLVGFYREDDTSRGVLKPLLAQVSVWEEWSGKSGEEAGTILERCVLIAIDSIGFTTELTKALRDQVGGELGISREKVMVCFSHTHAAPDAEAAEGYFDFARKKVLSAAKKALDGMDWVKVRCENGRAQIGVNRRAGNDALDDRVGILEAFGELEERRLMILRVTAHGNVLKADNYLVSPDYFGDVREVLTEKYGCPVMMIQGATGNIAPKYFCSKNTPVDAQGPQFVRSENALAMMAQELCRSVAKAIEGRIPETSSVNANENANEIANRREGLDLQAYSKELTLRSVLPSMERAKKIAAEAKETCRIDGTDWLAELSRLHGQGVSVQEEKAEVQYFRIARFCLCGMAYELMTEFALAAAEGLKNEFFYLNGYANGILSYFPTKEEYDLGGYEVYWSLLIYHKAFHRVFPFEREEADKVTEFVMQNAPTGRTKNKASGKKMVGEKIPLTL